MRFTQDSGCGNAYSAISSATCGALPPARFANEREVSSRLGDRSLSVASGHITNNSICPQPSCRSNGAPNQWQLPPAGGARRAKADWYEAKRRLA